MLSVDCISVNKIFLRNMYNDSFENNQTASGPRGYDAAFELDTQITVAQTQQRISNDETAITVSNLALDIGTSAAYMWLVVHTHNMTS